MAAYRSPFYAGLRRVLPTWLIISGFLGFILGVTLWQESAAHSEGLLTAIVSSAACIGGFWLRYLWPESRQRVRRAVELDARLIR